MNFFSRQHWAIHNPLKSWTLAGLSLRECQVLVATMSDADMKISWVFHKTWTEWKPLGDELCHTLFKLNEIENMILPTLPAMKSDDRDHDITQVVSAAGTGLNNGEHIQRKYTRFAARVFVDILVGSHSFSTQTADLSEGGFLFEDPLPEWVAGYFTVKLKVPGQNFEFTCFLAEDQKKEKFRIEIAPTNSQSLVNEFRNWLEIQNFPVPVRS